MTAKNVEAKMGEQKSKASAGGGGETFNLDGILLELGWIGKYQMLLVLLLAFRDSFLAMCNYHYIFTAAEVAYRCAVPECEDVDSSFSPSWAPFALTSHAVTSHAACRRPAPAHLHAWRTCAPDQFSRNHTVACEHLVYENYNSIVAEFDLGCEPWKRTLIGTVHNLGLVFSFVLSGIISDRYGRKVIIVATPLTVAVVGLLKSFSVNYWMLVVLELIETVFGYGNASMVLSLELVSHKRRVYYSCLSDVLSSIGFAFIGLIAWKVPYWRSLMRAIYAPLLVVVFYIFLVDEGVRWLLAHDKRAEAVRVLNKVAKINNITLSQKAKAMLVRISEEKVQVDKVEPSPKRSSFEVLKALRSRTILLRMCLIAACFFCGTFVFSGTLINSASISGDMYINFSAMQLVSVPTRIIMAFTLTRFGRKAPICIAYCLCSIFFVSAAFSPPSSTTAKQKPIIACFGRKVPICIAYCLCSIFFVAAAFSPPTMSWMSLLLYLLGKMCISYGQFALWVVAMEVFPTTSRNSLTNIASTVGRLGSVLAPQAPLLEKHMKGLASLLLGGAALGPALLSLLLPDASRVALPDDVNAAENIEHCNGGDDDGDKATSNKQSVDEEKGSSPEKVQYEEQECVPEKDKETQSVGDVERKLNKVLKDSMRITDEVKNDFAGEKQTENNVEDKNDRNASADKELRVKEDNIDELQKTAVFRSKNESSRNINDVPEENVVTNFVERL